MWQVVGETHDLRQIKRIVPYCVEDQILKFVHYAKQVVSQRSHCGVEGARAASGSRRCG